MSKSFRAILSITALSIIFATIWHFTFEVRLLTPYGWKGIVMFCSVPVGLTVIDFVARYFRGKQPRTLSSTANTAFIGISTIIVITMMTIVSCSVQNIIENEILAFGQSTFGLPGFLMECVVYIIGVMIHLVFMFSLEEKKTAAQAETEK